LRQCLSGSFLFGRAPARTPAYGGDSKFGYQALDFELMGVGFAMRGLEVVLRQSHVPALKMLLQSGFRILAWND
jgi:hypothetical protein